MDELKEFAPRLNDFGDDYHKSDEELRVGDDELTQQVKSVRRKYRTYREYVAACDLINEYMERLVDKYGGERNFRLYYENGRVCEYIPFMPKFRNTESNRWQDEHHIILDTQIVEPQNFSIDEETDKAIELASEIGGNGCDVEVLSTEDVPSIMKDKKIRDKFLSNSDHIVEELDMLRQITVASNSGKKKKKKSSRNLLKEAKRRKKLLSKVGIGGGRKVKDLLKEYAARVDGTFEEDEGDATVMYRGVTIRKSELDDIELMDIMKKAGFTRRSDNSMVHSKKMRKMIRNRTKEAKKRNKKKHSGEVDEEFLDEYIDSDQFGTNFKAFEKDMLAFTGDTVRRGAKDIEYKEGY